MQTSKLLAAGSVALALGLAGAAKAADFAYMTGGSEPWGSNTNVQAMDGAFGAGNWDHFNGFDSGVFTSGYAFIYFDGGDGQAAAFNSFMSSNVGAVETFVNAGGRIMSNAGRWDFGDLNLGFGTMLVGDGGGGYGVASNNASVTAAGVLAGLDGGGAGTNFTGNYFAHEIVTGTDVCYVSGDFGCVFGAVAEGLFVGSQTNTNFHSTGGLQLRINELQYAAEGAVNVGGVPEPATWALMIGGFGMAGAMIRRRKAVLA